MQKPLLQDQLELPSTYSIYKRLANLGLTFAAIYVGIQLWIFSAGQDQEILQAQANQLGHSLIRHSAKVAAHWITQNNPAAIEQSLQQLIDDDHVVSASYHNAKGELLYRAGKDDALVGWFAQPGEPPLVYVQEVIVGGELQAYLRLLLDRNQVLQYFQQYQENRRQQSQLLLAIAFGIGVMLTRAFYKIRYRRTKARKRKILQAE
ncbi:AhpA/YtjB family protein [Aliiglaciecola sp. CAU 1673]|uniref:AhpA/YtjB family protein n=1 Tax=Aliiglaciecola sp. CAU 1673 TaxID=3032595 RepID=UPI0023DB90D2|nr:AhpA/YtjB family protein [Aliiglaciecola sp. CAU 1673]MDF2178004.1 AhpA/YtjB family protein [Aliiglaciecola sp. CAU 1673]